MKNVKLQCMDLLLEGIMDIAKVNLHIQGLAHRIVIGKLTRLLSSLRLQRRILNGQWRAMVLIQVEGHTRYIIQELQRIWLIVKVCVMLRAKDVELQLLDLVESIIATVIINILGLANQIRKVLKLTMLLSSLRLQRRRRKPPKQLIPRPRLLQLRKTYMIISTL